MDRISLLKKYAYFYLSKYDSTKKNLEIKLKNRIIKMKDIDKNEKNILLQKIDFIIEDLESKKLINDNDFAKLKINNLSLQGKSEFFIKKTLIKKGVKDKIINELFLDFNNNNPNWKIESAKKFAYKKKLGKYNDSKNKDKNKDIAKMARAGFDYQMILEVLGYA